MGYCRNGDFYWVKELFFASLLLVMAFTEPLFSWERGVSLGYNYCSEPGEDYTNQGVLLNLKLFKLGKIDRTLIFSLDASAAYWKASTPEYSSLGTIALLGAFRGYFVSPELHRYAPYIAFSVGPALLSQTQFASHKQGAPLAFQFLIGGGVEVALPSLFRSLDLNLHIVHYCNAGLFSPNQGFNMLYLFSVGYLF